MSKTLKARQSHSHVPTYLRHAYTVRTCIGTHEKKKKKKEELLPFPLLKIVQYLLAGIFLSCFYSEADEGCDATSS